MRRFITHDELPRDSRFIRQHLIADLMGLAPRRRGRGGRGV